MAHTHFILLLGTVPLNGDLMVEVKRLTEHLIIVIQDIAMCGPIPKATGLQTNLIFLQ